MKDIKITKHQVADDDCGEYVYKLFGDDYSTYLELHVFNSADDLSSEYGAETWNFFSLSNGGFFMSPRLGTSFNVSCARGNLLKMSAEGFGITACLFAFSRLSFGSGPFAEECRRHYHLLRAFVFEHLEVNAILRATD